jgi:uncharacterized protein YlxW (UPF0749 family)
MPAVGTAVPYADDGRNDVIVALGRLLKARRRRSPSRSRGGWAVAVPAVLALAGLIAATSAQTARGTDLRSDGRTSTADLIREQEYRARVQEREVNALRQRVDALARRGAPAGSELAGLSDRANAVSPAAGLTAVVGPALKVELNDAPSQDSPPSGFTPDDLVVHQQDVQAVVNALWSSGAEAMMLMDQRVVSTSAVRCVGNVLILQDRVYSPPYRITAIGDVAAMQSALDSSRTVQVYRQYVDAVGLGYQVKALGQRRFPAFDGSLLLPHVRTSGGAP